MRISMVFHSGPGLPGLARGRVRSRECRYVISSSLLSSGWLSICTSYPRDGHPGFCGFGRYTDEYTGVIVLVLHPVDDLDLAIGQGTDGRIEKPHAALGLQHAVLHGEAARPYVLPAA